MAKDYSKLLIELKPMLPRGYQREIARSLASVELWQIKKAFSARNCARPALKKIYNKAVRIAQKEQEELLKASKEVKAIRKLSRSTR